MKKVIHMISSMNVGGAETMVKDYALLMDKNEFDVKIISLDICSHSANEKALAEAGIPIVYLSELHYSADKKLNVAEKIIRKMARYYDLRKIIKTEQPDILHVHLHIGKYLKTIPFKKWGIKLFYTVHNVPERFFDNTGKDKKRFAEYKEVKRLLKKAGLQLIVLHEGMNKQLRELFDTEHVITVNNGVNLEKFHRELYDRSATRQVLGITEDTLLLGHIGRFHEQKNHEFLVRVFHEVCKKKASSHLLMVGIGTLRKEVEKQVHELGLDDKVTILQNRNDIPELMCAMDVFVFPSRWEGFGNVMIEAQNMGIPCVVSDRIHENVIVNDNVTVLSLDAPLDEWSDAVINGKMTSVSETIWQYDMKNSVKKLESIYMS